MTPLVFGTQVILPIVLIIVMFGLGLSLTGADFTRVLRTPRPAIVGILGHAILLPLAAFTVLTVFDFPPMVAGGLVILSACPGGVTSNAVVYAGRGDVALAVSLTAISSVVTVFTIPIVVGFGLTHFAGMDASVNLGFMDTVTRLGSYILLPLFSGMTIKYFFPVLAERVESYFRILAMIVFAGILVASWMIIGGLEIIDLQLAFTAVVLLLASASTAGYVACTLARLDTMRTMTIVIEIAVQNVTTAYLIAGSILKEPGLLLTPAIYGVMMFVTSAIVVWLARRRAAAA
ncbi:MAG: bile acid:sodium symporter [Alphaproteobacteria bacterium]